MTSEANTQGTVDATTALLQAELPRLEEHQQALEKELATVTERLESVRTALTALQALSTAPPAPAPVLVGNEPSAVPAPSANAETETENVAAPKIPRQAQGRTDSAVEAEAPQEEAAATPARRTARKAPVAKGRKQAPAKQKSEPAKKAVTAKAAKPAKAAEPAKAVKPAKAKAPKKAAPAAPAVDDSGSLTEMAMKVLATFGDTPVRARDVTKALGRELTPGSINTVRSTLDRLVGTSRAHRAGRGLYQAPAN
ncbi:hypothetical protein [Streptomyces sp. NBC_01669]|uniref:hypothetical protein n=1 Tax=Streptomyces sp. NBC_01669 TaxID=2975909 RepID=UPI00224D9B25|nr:hypothetical protein [Streptomyces sp. NBC_01669]MCX4534868.1 hypothetical protein [Streptomyces sp. NBC_01669]